MSRRGVLILAAGSASRMGQPKQLMRLDGITLIRRCASTALASECRPVVVVLGANADEIRAKIADLDVTIVLNPNWSAGMGTSIRAGIAALGEADAAVLTLCDQPLVTVESIRRLLAAQCGEEIVAAAYGGTLGTPAVFPARYFGELLALADDQGGKAVINRHRPTVISVDVPEAEIDVDTPADFAKIVRPC